MKRNREKSEKIEYFLVSNMYPKSESDSFGIFIKKIAEILIAEEITPTAKALITGRASGLNRKLLSYLGFYLGGGVEGLLAKYKFIYIHFASHSTVIAAAISVFRDKPIIINFHGSDLLNTSIVGRINHFCFEYLIRKKKIKLIISPSPNFAKRIIDQKKINTDLVVVSPSGGIDSSFFSPINSPENESTSDKIFTIGYFSRLDLKKGWPVLLEALSKLKNEGTIFNCKFGGDPDNIVEFDKLVAKKNLGNCVTHQNIERSHLPEFFNSLDLFVFPTQYTESLGLVALEALSCGIPVIAPNNGAPIDYIKNGSNGFLFESGDAEDLMAKITVFYGLDLTTRNNYKKKARETGIQYDTITTGKNLAKQIRLAIQ